MIKKIVLLIMIITFTSSCDYSPVHSNKENNIEINIINISGDSEINDYLIRELKRKSKSSSEKMNVQINTSFSKRILAKNTKSFATDYELKIVGDFELQKGDKSKSFTISEKFRYKNQNDNYEQSNYESMIKKNLIKIIVNKLILRINSFK
tara:strand:- start:2521 stop:2973 length:453 start_codon:yes stop_codon:yes gene_type:complete